MLMKGPDGWRSVMIGGQSFTPDENGFVDVPDTAAGDLASHGFEPAPVVEQKSRAARKAAAAPVVPETPTPPAESAAQEAAPAASEEAQQ